MALDLNRARICLQGFEFSQLFIEELGWSQPTSSQTTLMNCHEKSFIRRQVAQLAGVVVFEISAQNGQIPDAKTRATLHKEISTLHHENLLIFLDKQRTQSLWYWVKREPKRAIPREHLYVRGQPGDLFLGKLNAMVVDMSDLDERGDINVLEVACRLNKALDIERVTKKFYAEFDKQRHDFTDLIQGIDDEHDRHWYASVLLNRLMFIYFLQRKGFIDNGNMDYLQKHLTASQARGEDRYFSEFLQLLFFEGFAKPEEKRSARAKKLLGRVRYLNGGLFLPHRVELNKHYKITAPDKAFEDLFHLFASYSWNLDDTPSGKDDEINPDVLGYIFEKYINQKAFGAYYTRTEITEYLCEQTIYRLVLQQVNIPSIPGKAVPKHFKSVPDLLVGLDAHLCHQLLFDVLPKLSLLDPACGSGAFLVAAMKTLINLYSAVIGKIEFLGDKLLSDWLRKTHAEHSSLPYFIKRRIITDNLFGVDIMDEAAEIGRLRLFLALVASVQTVEQLEPLPNIDFNILPGNSLIGLLRVDEGAFDRHTKQSNMFQKPYEQLLDEKRRQLEIYRHTTQFVEDLQFLRDKIEKSRLEASRSLNDLLLDEFTRLGIKYQQSTWDNEKSIKGKTVKRDVRLEDVEALHPFHWGYEFDEVMNRRGGFDAIITNPPWEIFKPNAKEFFESFSSLVTKKKMNIKDFEKEQAKLLKDPEIRKAWLEYLNLYPHVSSFFRSADQYKNQISMVNGKKTGSDINYYKLFTEQCFNLLRDGGCCGIVIPSGIYTDLGTKQLREMLFGQTRVTGLFCFENRKVIFEGVHRSFKFLVLSFEKGGKTGHFPAAFMRHNIEELSRFPRDGAINISVGLIRRLSPDSLSVIEFKNEMDVNIAEKMLRFPLLGDELPDKWNLQLTREFDMTQGGASSLIVDKPFPAHVQLYEGKMIWHYNHRYAQPNFWVNEKGIRRFLLKSNMLPNVRLSADSIRLVLRRQSASTNERTLVSTLIPPAFHADNLASVVVFNEDGKRVIENSVQLFICAIFNSMVMDYSIRNRITTNLNFFYIYQLPAPRLSRKDSAFWPIVKRAAQLICTTPEFDDLAKEVGLNGHMDGTTDPGDRRKLQAELDGLIAHLYGLTKDEFSHILTTFPIVPEVAKRAAMKAFNALSPKTADVQLATDIAAGESTWLEFKSSARWDFKENRINKVLEQMILKTTAAFLNTDGGTLLIGVDDDGKILGLEHDYKTFGKKQNQDVYQNWLTTLLLREFGKDSAPLIQINIYMLGGKEICRVSSKPSSKPVYVKDGKGMNFYIRAGNSTRQLSTKEAVEYCRQHWP
ncbi:Eco57I restriction-modification methylase domain-containing protein [Chloroflexota bacterium]